MAIARLHTQVLQRRLCIGEPACTSGKTRVSASVIALAPRAPLYMGTAEARRIATTPDWPGSQPDR